MKKASEPRSDPEIERFIDSLWAQKGLAELTLRAYRQDLVQFSRWLDKVVGFVVAELLLSGCTEPDPQGALGRLGVDDPALQKRA